MSDSEAPRSDGPPRDPMDAPIDVTFAGLEVLLAVRPPSGDEAPATVDEALAVLKRSPLTRVERSPVESAIAEQSGTAAAVGEVTVPAEAEGWFIAASPDRLAAYLVPVPPPPPPDDTEDTPADTVEDESVATPASEDDDATQADTTIESSAIDRKRRELGITSGMLQEVVDGFDPARELTNICCVARGRSPVEGRNGVITWLLDSGEEHAPVDREDGSVDHHSMPVKRFVEEGEPLARRTAPVIGTDGEDIFGETIEARAVRDPAIEEIAGENTEVRGDELVAKISGLPRAIGEKINVLLIYEVSGDLDYSVGNIEFAGDVVVGGDMKPGFAIVATGSVTIRGMTERATIRAGGDITVQGVVGARESAGAHEDGEHGDETHELEAGGDLTAQYLNGVAAKAGGEIQVNREIVNCTLTATRVTTSSNGRIVGGEVTASTEISSGSLGSQHGVPTRLCVPAATEDGPAVIRGGKAVHDGVEIHVGNATLAIDEELAGASFWQLSGKVARLDSHADAAALERFAQETDQKVPTVRSDNDTTDDDPTDDATNDSLDAAPDAA